MENIGNISLTKAPDLIGKKRDELISQAVQKVENIISKIDEGMLHYSNLTRTYYFCVKDMEEVAELDKLSTSCFWENYCKREFDNILKDAGWRYSTNEKCLYVVN